MTAEELAEKIVHIIQTPGEHATDGEVLDDVITLLIKSGFQTPWSPALSTENYRVQVVVGVDVDADSEARAMMSAMDKVRTVIGAEPMWVTGIASAVHNVGNHDLPALVFPLPDRTARVYCDDCGENLAACDSYPIERLPRRVWSANVGESAILCKQCYRKVIQPEEAVKESVSWLRPTPGETIR